MEIKRKTCCGEGVINYAQYCLVFRQDKDRETATGFGKMEVTGDLD